MVVVSSPTFLSILSAWFLARVKRAKLVVEVRDLWPAIFVELGILRNRTIIRALEHVELAVHVHPHPSLQVLSVPGGSDRCVMEPDKPCVHSGACRVLGH